MCAVSMIYDYGRNNWPRDDWSNEGIFQFKKMVEDAKKFDIITHQPDCEDPEKEKFLKELEQWIVEQRN